MNEMEAHLERASKEQQAYADFIADLLAGEVEARRTRYLRTRMRLAHLPYQKSFEHFDFGFQPASALTDCTVSLPSWTGSPAGPSFICGTSQSGATRCAPHRGHRSTQTRPLRLDRQTLTSESSLHQSECPRQEHCHLAPSARGVWTVEAASPAQGGYREGGEVGGA